MNYLQVKPDNLSLHFPILNRKILDAEVPDSFGGLEDGYSRCRFRRFLWSSIYSFDFDQESRLEDTLNFYSSVFNDFFASFMGKI